jgi:hypothetical protein
MLSLDACPTAFKCLRVWVRKGRERGEGRREGEGRRGKGEGRRGKGEGDPRGKLSLFVMINAKSGIQVLESLVRKGRERGEGRREEEGRRGKEREGE